MTLVLLSREVQGQERPEALQGYLNHLNWANRVQFHVQTDIVATGFDGKIRQRFHYEYAVSRDSDRLYESGTIEETEGPEAPYKAIDQYLRGLKGHENMFLECQKYDSGWNVNAFESSKEKVGVLQSSPESGGPLYGRFTNASIEKSFGQLLDEQTTAIAEEEIDGRKVVAISGASKQGNITVWVDPEAGYAPVKCRIEKVVGQHLNGAGTGPFAPAPLGDVKAIRWTLTMDNIKLEEIQGVWLPVSAEVLEIGELEDGRTTSAKTSIRLTDVGAAHNPGSSR